MKALTAGADDIGKLTGCGGVAVKFSAKLHKALLALLKLGAQDFLRFVEFLRAARSPVLREPLLAFVKARPRSRHALVVLGYLGAQRLQCAYPDVICSKLLLVCKSAAGNLRAKCFLCLGKFLLRALQIVLQLASQRSSGSRIPARCGKFIRSRLHHAVYLAAAGYLVCFISAQPVHIAPFKSGALFIQSGFLGCVAALRCGSLVFQLLLPLCEGILNLFLRAELLLERFNP